MAERLSTASNLQVQSEVFIDQARRALRARMRFKAIVRLAYINRSWLTEIEVGTQTLTKQRHPRMRDLYKMYRITLADKAIFCKQPQYRTAVEKDRIYKIISFRKSFRKYPEYIVRQLACVTYYTYFDANRTIVRQHQPAQAMYFILSGSCQSIEYEYDQQLQENIQVHHFILQAGDAFGEFALLHNVTRVSTITTLTSCEFLFLKADDFNEILRDLFLRDWHTLTTYMNKFTYFQDWDEVIKRECCMVAKKVQFNRDDTILGKSENEKILPMVYFVISGTCTVIEFLLVRERMVQGLLKRTYYSYKEEDEMNHTAGSIGKSVRSLATRLARMKQAFHPHMNKLNRRVDELYQANEDRVDVSDDDDDDDEGYAMDVKVKPPPTDMFYPEDLQTYFIKICTYSENACFNIGENLRRRCIVANTDMLCMAIPRYWLMARGWSKNWGMIKDYLNREIPSSEKIYEEFIEKRKYTSYKKDFVASLPHKIAVNCKGNFPYSIRMKKDFNNQ